MATTTDIVYGPHPRVKLIPSAVATSLAMSVATGFVTHYNVNGMSEPAGYTPSFVFFVFGAVFAVLYWRKMVRVTISGDGVSLERLLPRPHRLAEAKYSEIVDIKQGRVSLKLSLLAEDGRVLLVLPDAVTRISGELTPAAKAAVSEKAAGLVLEIYEMRQEIAHRVEQLGGHHVKSES